MSLNNILKRNPAVAIVDELAHTNVPGSRNKKRYQDVLELLDAGINVIGAFNVQHLESLNDIVERATGVAVRETLPDSFLKQADQVVNLDLAVEDLQERLRAGKIYARRQDPVGAGALLQGAEPGAPARARAARGRRERRARERAAGRARSGPRGRRRRAAQPGHGLPVVGVAARRRRWCGRARGWPGASAPTGSSCSSRRPGRRRSRSTPARSGMLLANTDLARELGAEVIRLRARDPVHAILEFARSHGVGHVVVGRSDQPSWKQLFGRSIPIRLVREGERPRRPRGRDRRRGRRAVKLQDQAAARPGAAGDRAGAGGRAVSGRDQRGSADQSRLILADNYRSVLAAQRMKEALERIDETAVYVLVGHTADAAAEIAPHRRAFENELAVQEGNVTEAGEGSVTRALRQRLERRTGAASMRYLALGAAAERERAYFGELKPVFTRVKQRADEVLAHQPGRDGAQERSRLRARRALLRAPRHERPSCWCSSSGCSPPPG